MNGVRQKTLSPGFRSKVLCLCLLFILVSGSRILAREPSLDLDASKDLPQSIARLLGPKDSLLAENSKGEILYSYNPNALRTPASTFKVFTSLLALKILGEDFHFKTEIYQDGEGNLKIKGYGDPLLISEVLEPLAGEIAFRTKSCKQIVLDSSYFKTPLEIPGTGSTANPYDAPVGALCVNFNTVFFTCDANGKLASAEDQTPLIPFAEKIIRSKTETRNRG